jgi:hypothetical protein
MLQVNLTVKHGCLFVNEKFLRFGPEHAQRSTDRAEVGGPDCSLTRSFELDPPGCTIRLKDYGQPKYGLHAISCTDPLCSDSQQSPCYSDDTTTRKPHCYGRMCTKMISIEGRFPDINKALSNVTYLSDFDFNTYYGYDEVLTIQVSDNGLLGDALDTPTYRHELEIPIIVKPVNDAPTVGRLADADCVDMQDDGTIALADTKKEKRLFQIVPALDFIDVNEDTVFTIMPDRVWIADVDSEEAQIRNKFILKCAGECGSVAPEPNGCCRTEVCPELCNKVRLAALGAAPSQVLVEFKVEFGLLSFYPPFTRGLLAGIEFMTNLTTLDIKAGGEIKPCPVQLSCMRNQTAIWLRGQISVIQQALKWGFLTYQGGPNRHGTDSLQIWISDDGYSDVEYLQPLTASTRIPIQVIPINDDPTVTFPGGQGCSCSKMSGLCTCESIPPLLFTKGEPCENNWMKNSFTDAWPQGRALDCKKVNETKVPNKRSQYQGFPMLEQPITFDDVDMNDTPHGNMTIEIIIGRKNAGSFTIRTIMQTVRYLQYVDDDELLHLRLRGKMSDLNLQMTELYYNANDDYSGPAPFQLSINDNNNYGICTPTTGLAPYQCDRALCQSANMPANLLNNFLCGLPVIDQLSLFSGSPGGIIPCKDVRLFPNGQITVRFDGSWSGPFSCLGCGYYVSSTRQVCTPQCVRRAYKSKINSRKFVSYLLECCMY